MLIFPAVAATIEQALAYARYFAEKRDLGAALFGVLFLAVCIVPAVLLDLLRLPLRLPDLARNPSRTPHHSAQRQSRT
jgi:hypothetical protein